MHLKGKLSLESRRPKIEELGCRRSWYKNSNGGREEWVSTEEPEVRGLSTSGLTRRHEPCPAKEKAKPSGEDVWNKRGTLRH